MNKTRGYITAQYLNSVINQLLFYYDINSYLLLHITISAKIVLIIDMSIAYDNIIVSIV